MKYIRNKLVTYKTKISRGFKYAIRKQCQLVLRFLFSFLLFSFTMWILHPKTVEYTITPQFKIIDGEYKTTFWKNPYYQQICQEQKQSSEPFWVQQCILSNIQLPTMKNDIVTIELTNLEYKYISTVKLCRYISSINKSICDERFVQSSKISISGIDLGDITFLSVVLRLQKQSSYLSHPTITIHTNPNIISLVIHRHYFIYCMMMATIFSILISMILIMKDVYYYNDYSDLIQYQVSASNQSESESDISRKIKRK